MDNHPLRAEIIATALANQMVNEMGCNYVTRMQEETGAHIVDIANAYAACREIFGLDKVLTSLRALDNKASTDAQYDMMFYVRRTMRRLSRWVLRNRTGRQCVKALVELYQGDVDIINAKLDDILVPAEVEEHKQMAQSWIDQGITPDIAIYVSRLSSLYSVFDISTVARETGISVEQVAKLYFHLGDRLSLHWFLNQINAQAVDNNWQALGRAAFREDLDWQQRQLTGQVLNCHCAPKDLDVMKALDDWISKNEISLTSMGKYSQ